MVQFANWCTATDFKVGAHDMQVLTGSATHLAFGIDATAALVPGHYASEEHFARVLRMLGKPAAAAMIEQKLPTTKPTPPPGGWWSYKEDVKGYAGLSGPPSTADTVFACPSDRGYAVTSERVLPFWKNPKHNFTSYVFNGVTLPGLPNVSGRDLKGIRQPERTLLVMEWTAQVRPGQRC